MMKKLILSAIFILLTSCSNPTEATRVLESAGFTNIAIDGYSFFGCSEDDFYHTKFTATNSNGKRVEGVVCSGLFFKNSTIRF